MPLTIPPFNQYQSPIVPLRGLWNSAPPEGDRFVSAEIDWLVTTTQQAVQFAISANSPVAFSQIVALAVDNSRCGSDVDFVFSDSGFVLTVPAHEQCVAPVFTNALMFYVIGQSAAAGDVTAFSVLNSMPPPIMVAPPSGQNHAVVGAIAVANGSTPIVPPPTSGMLNTISMSIAMTAGVAAVVLQDGLGRSIWGQTFELPTGASQTFLVNLTGLNVRFVNGLSCVVSGVTATGGPIDVNVYFTTP